MRPEMHFQAERLRNDFLADGTLHIGQRYCLFAIANCHGRFTLRAAHELLNTLTTGD